MTIASSPILELRNAAKTFMVSRGFFNRKTPLHAVRGVSLKISKGDVLGLVGESGCGKTTLAMMLLGLLPPTRGEVLIDGQDIFKEDRRSVAKRIQPVFQDPFSSLNPRKTIGQIVSLPLRVHKACASSKLQSHVEEMLNIVGLQRRHINCYPNQLSGGQRQRVAVARALIMKPEVVLLDEPTSALDVSVQSQILNLLLDLRSEFNLTYILISHDLSVVEHMANKVAVMYLGRIVESSDTETIFANTRHPYSKALLESVLTPDTNLGVPNTYLGTTYPNPIDPPSGCTFHPRCVNATSICSQHAPKPSSDKNDYVECHLFNDLEQDITKPVGEEIGA